MNIVLSSTLLVLLIMVSDAYHQTGSIGYNEKYVSKKVFNHKIRQILYHFESIYDQINTELIKVQELNRNVLNTCEENLTKVIEKHEKDIKTQKSDFTQELSKQEKLIIKQQKQFDNFTKMIENSQNKINCGDDWTSYLNRKCFKVLENTGNIDEAKGNCSEIESSLITIESEEEQLFLANILEKYNNISDKVWIGLEMGENNLYKWLNGNELEYENWDEDSVQKERCVEMPITRPSLGKWTDTQCYENHLIICEKKQNTKIDIQEELKNLTKVIERQETELKKHQDIIVEQQNQIKTQENKINSLIPIGFLYTQLPNQFSPQQLWPNMKWNEVTKEYSGLFFRTEGSGSEPFGKIQQANQSLISEVEFWAHHYDSWSGDHYNVNKTSLEMEKWSQLYFVPNRDAAFTSLNFYTTGGEVRPKNTAIKIWKRVQ